MPARNILFAGQGVLIKDLVLAATDQTRMSLHASDQSVAVSGDRESGERPEGSFAALGGNRGGTLEANDS